MDSSCESGAGLDRGLYSRLRVFIRRLLRIRTRQARPAPLYYSDLRGLTDDEWRMALSESPEKAARVVYAAAVYGNIDAQLYWAQMLLDGYAERADHDAAFRWFEIAAKSRRPDAVNMLGRCYERGWGVPIDLAKAAACYRDAAAQGHDWAQFNLACLMMEGLGTARDPNAAFQLFNKAAQQNLVKSFHMVGQCHEHGIGCVRDFAEATRWYRRSAEGGDFRGQFRYGLLLFDAGRIEDAVAWVQMSIENCPAPLRPTLAAELRSHPAPRLRQLADAH